MVTVSYYMLDPLIFIELQWLFFYLPDVKYLPLAERMTTRQSVFSFKSLKHFPISLKIFVYYFNIDKYFIFKNNG